jgi:hypothetical protein
MFYASDFESILVVNCYSHNWLVCVKYVEHISWPMTRLYATCTPSACRIRCTFFAPVLQSLESRSKVFHHRAPTRRCRPLRRFLHVCDSFRIWSASKHTTTKIVKQKTAEKQVAETNLKPSSKKTSKNTYNRGTASQHSVHRFEKIKLTLGLGSAANTFPIATVCNFSYDKSIEELFNYLYFRDWNRYWNRRRLFSEFDFCD